MKKFLVKYGDRSFILKAKDGTDACEKVLKKVKDSEKRFTVNSKQEALNLIKAYDGSYDLVLVVNDGLVVSITPSSNLFIVSAHLNRPGTANEKSKSTLDEAKKSASAYVNLYAY